MPAASVWFLRHYPLCHWCPIADSSRCLRLIEQTLCSLSPLFYKMGTLDTLNTARLQLLASAGSGCRAIGGSLTLPLADVGIVTQPLRPLAISALFLCHAHRCRPLRFEHLPGVSQPGLSHLCMPRPPPEHTCQSSWHAGCSTLHPPQLQPSTACRPGSGVRTHLGDALEHLLLGHLVRCQLRANNRLHLVHQLHVVLRDKAQRPALQPWSPVRLGQP